MFRNKFLHIAGSVIIMTPLLGFASPAVAVSPSPAPTTQSTTGNAAPASSQNVAGKPVSSSAVATKKEKIRRVNMLQCKKVRNTKRGGFQCVSPKKVKVRAKLGSTSKPTEILINKEWVKTPYLWKKKRKALVLSSGMVPWVESMNSRSNMSPTYMLRMTEEDGTRKAVRMRVGSDGWGMSPTGAKTNYKWDPKKRSFTYVKPTTINVGDSGGTGTGTGTGTGGGSAAETGTSPEAPTNLKATPKDSSVELSWTAPTRDGGSAITSYEVNVSPQGGTISIDGTKATITGLLNGTQYSFTVKANNGIGSSPASNPTQATPMSAPSSPTGIVAKAEKSGEVRLSWNPNPSIEGVQNYVVVMDPLGAETEVSGTTAVVRNLTLGRSYEFSVKAINPIGESTPSNKVTEKAVATSSAPSNVQARASESTIDLSWNEPTETGGAAIIDYQIFYSANGGETWIMVEDDVAPLTKTTLEDMENGTTYYLTVVPITSVGAGEGNLPVAATPYTKPDAPENVVATPRDGGMHLSWSEPTFNGGKSVDYYSLSYSENGLDWTEYSPLSVAEEGSSTGALTHGTISGLNNGQEYLFRVIAGNDVGSSDPSAEVAATPASVPNAPRNVVIVEDEGSLSVSWDEPDWDGGTTLGEYEIGTTPLVDQNNITIVDRTATISGLTNGVEYEVFVRATNSQGASATSEPVMGTPYTTPDAPTTLVVSEHSTALDVSWVAPEFDGGHTISEYVVSVSPSVGTMTMMSDTSARITGLQNGRNYYVSVKSVNPRGESTESETVVGVPRTAPSAPMTVSATPGDTQVQLSWNPPADDGGAVIEGYDVQIFPRGGANINVDGTTATITGLTNGYGYYFTVTARNEAGDSPASMLVSSVPRTVPNVPMNVAVLADIERLDLSWSAPDWDGGRPVDGYEVRVTPEHGTITMLSDYSAEVTGLVPNTNYLVTVRASNEAGWSEYTNPVLGVTPPAAPEFSPEEQACEQEECLISWNEPAGTVSFEVYRDGVLLGTIEESSFLDPATLDAESIYTYTIVPLNGLGTQGQATEIEVLTKPADPQVLAGPDYIVSTEQVEVVVAAPNPEGGVTYDTGYDEDANALGTNVANVSGSAVLARGLSGLGLGDDSTQADSVSCTGATCTLRWDSFLNNLGTKWYFALQPRNATGTSQQVTLTRPAPDTSDIDWNIFETHYYCPEGYPHDIGNNTCQKRLNYTYSTSTSCGQCCSTSHQMTSGFCCPGGGACSCPGGWGSSYGQWGCPAFCCLLHENVTTCSTCCSTVTVKNPTPSGWSDNGSFWYQNAPKIDYKTYEVKTSYAWNNTNAATTYTGDFVVNRVGLERTVRNGESGDIGDCPGTVTVDVRGIGGTTTKTFGTPCTPAPNVSTIQACPFGYAEFGAQCRKTVPYDYEEQSYTYTITKEYENYSYTTETSPYTYSPYQHYVQTGWELRQGMVIGCTYYPSTDTSGCSIGYYETRYSKDAPPAGWIDNGSAYERTVKVTTPPSTPAPGTPWADNGTRWESNVAVKDSTPSGWTDDGSKWIQKSAPPAGYTDDGTQYVSIVNKESQTVYN